MLDPFVYALLPPRSGYPGWRLGFARCSHLQPLVEQFPVRQNEKHTPAGASFPFPRPLLLARGVVARPRAPSSFPVFVLPAFFAAAIARAFPPPFGFLLRDMAFFFRRGVAFARGGRGKNRRGVMPEGTLGPEPTGSDWAELARHVDGSKRLLRLVGSFRLCSAAP